MKTYLLSIYQPDGEAPSPELLAPVMEKVSALLQEAKQANVWVFNGGLHAPSTASIVRVRGHEVMTTDGPFVEAKEHVGGFLVIRVPDLDAALDWAARLGRALMLPGNPNSLPIEVRPFEHVGF